MDFNSIYQFAFLHFVFSYSAVLIISASYVASICNKPPPPVLPPPLPPPFLFPFYTRAMYIRFWVMPFLHCYHLSSFSEDFLIPLNLQLNIPRAHLSTGTANALISVNLFFLLNLDFSFILHLLVYSFFSLSIIS